MGKTTKYVLIGGAVLLVAYFFFSKPTSLKTGTAATSGWAGILNGFGNASKGAGSLWTSIFGSSNSAPVDTTTDSGG